MRVKINNNIVNSINQRLDELGINLNNLSDLTEIKYLKLWRLTTNQVKTIEETDIKTVLRVLGINANILLNDKYIRVSTRLSTETLDFVELLKKDKNIDTTTEVINYIINEYKLIYFEEKCSSNIEEKITSLINNLYTRDYKKIELLLKKHKDFEMFLKLRERDGGNI